MNISDEIIKRVHNLTLDQQKDLLDHLKDLQKGQQREYPRLPDKMNIDAVVDDKVIQSYTRDISACGVYINTAGTVEMGKDAMVVFTIPDADITLKLNLKVASPYWSPESIGQGAPSAGFLS
ncbi:hypothetical protein HRM2_39470 [Desulforapulum autotrophicum HRM2]|uniref:PilZ domain-containing protein n=1 Tax=Desulforapulum autotrophicum (strain ATCC 43914 / DSM 3382 / VKM B-1955 / HRM2) TaxID=177437 RepID=C0QBK3_DESAH|nr:PilZ domain-containing protein [Desulforapulum autotrophicum]ACN17005.1 hypothetical protein HRM2_39470 [Desulforapulum autotrophicum HRM2]